MNLTDQTAAEALNIPEYISPADAETLVRWAEEARPIMDRYVYSAKVVSRLPKAVREEANRAHIVLALLARIVADDTALRSVTAERDAARADLAAERERSQDLLDAGLALETAYRALKYGVAR